MCAVRRREINRASYKRTTAKLRRKRRRTAKPREITAEMKLARKLASATQSRDMWKQRALAAEWGLKQRRAA